MAAPSKEQKESVKKRDGYTCQRVACSFLTSPARRR